MSIFNTLFYLFNVFIFIYVVFVAAFYLLLLGLSLVQVRKYMRRIPYLEYEEIESSRLTPPISIIVPAYNEEVTIKDSVLSLLHLNYPEYEVVVVNDGSKDATLERLIESYHLRPIKQIIRQEVATKEIRNVYRSVRYPSLIVIDKENGGKADALNAGINASKYPYFCGVDADSFLEHDALLKTMYPFLEGNENVVACGGIVRIANGCTIKDGRVLKTGLPKKMIAIHQVIEYLRSFLTGRIGFSGLNCLLIISGAFGVFRKKEVLEIGGYSTKTVGEDMELVVRLQKHLFKEKRNAKIMFVPDPVCWTEAPESIRVLSRQRTRWHIGLIETMLMHRDTIGNPRYGVMGTIAMPYFLFVELLGPTIELIGFVLMIVSLYLDIINIPFAILFLVATVVFGIFLSLGAVLLEEFSFGRYPRVRDLLKLTLFCIVENFWYRQVNSLWRTWAFIRYFRREKAWGTMERKGLSHTSNEGVSVSNEQ